jgi:hypothetical protein
VSLAAGSYILPHPQTAPSEPCCCPCGTGPASPARVLPPPPRQVLPLAKGTAMPNKTFISEWGDSLKQGSEQVWAGYLHSSYATANDEVHGKVGGAGTPPPGGPA